MKGGRGRNYSEPAPLFRAEKGKESSPHRKSREDTHDHFCALYNKGKTASRTEKRGGGEEALKASRSEKTLRRRYGGNGGRDIRSGRSEDQRPEKSIRTGGLSCKKRMKAHADDTQGQKEGQKNACGGEGRGNIKLFGTGRGKRGQTRRTE